MLKVTVELIPNGNCDKKEVIASADIWNDGTSPNKTGEYGSYQAIIREGNREYHRQLNCHRRCQSVWSLIRKILKEIRYR